MPETTSAGGSTPGSKIAADAPGKLLLLGEYAVLAGAPALVMAIDRRVRVLLEPVRDGEAMLHAPQLGIEDEPLRWSDSGLHGGPGLHRLGMTARLLPLLARGFGIASEQLNRIRIEIDSAELFAAVVSQPGSPEKVKLGLGSSGAVTAALVCALELLSGAAQGAVAERWERWLPAYRSALDSDASGADLAASLAGGLHLLRPGPDGGLQLEQRDWPEGLLWRAIWVGAPAQTVDYVAAFKAWQTREPVAAARLVAALGERVEAVGKSDSASTWLESFEGFTELIEPLGSAIGRAVLSAPHLRLRTLAREHAVVYKSCGAGGGDLGVAISSDPTRLEAFCRAAWSQDVHPLDLRIDWRGASARRIGSAQADRTFIA